VTFWKYTVLYFFGFLYSNHTVVESNAQWFSNQFQVTLLKGVVSLLDRICPTIERNLKSQRMRDGKLGFENHSSCCLLGWIISKGWLCVGDKFVEFWANKWIELILFIKGSRSIKERVHLSTMGMDIKKENSLLTVISYLLFEPKHFRLPFLTRKLPLPIYIHSWYVRAIVTIDYSINVYHWNDSKLISFA
jgi:hypothetical protein